MIYALPTAFKALVAAAQFQHDHPVIYWLFVLFGK